MDGPRSRTGPFHLERVHHRFQVTIRRLLWYCEAPLTFSGGGERLLLEGLRHLADQGIETALYADGQPMDRARVFNGAYSPRMIVIERSRGLAARIPVLRYFHRLRQDAMAMESFRPDFLIANSQYSSALLLIMKAMGRLRGIPFACFIHGSLFQFRHDLQKYALVFRSRFRQVWEADPVYRRTVPAVRPPMPAFARAKMEWEVLLQYLGVRRALAVFVLTEKNRNEMRLFYRHGNVQVAHGAFPRALLGAYSGPDLKPRWGLAGRPVILSVCRLEEKKQVDLILRSFARFRADRPEAGLVIGGTGPERARLEALAAELGITGDVRFAGFIPDAELHDHYLSADVFTSADIADYDITSLVGLALGRKTVVSSQHDFDPALAGLGQLFHADPTPEGFAAAFAKALAAPPPCDAATRARLLEPYTWEGYFATVRDRCEEALRRAGGPA